MKKPYVSNEQARAAQSRPSSFSWRGESYEIIPVVNVIHIVNDVGLAEAMAADLGTYAKHANAKFQTDGWTTMSIVGLP